MSPSSENKSMIKNTIKYLMLLLFVWGCQEEQKPPKNLIPEDKMVDIMYEMALIQAIKSYDYNLFNKKEIKPTQYIYQRFGVDSLQFVESNKFYASQLERYEKMHDAVIERISQHKKKSDSIVPQLKESKEPAKVADSIVNPKLLLPNKK